MKLNYKHISSAGTHTKNVALITFLISIVWQLGIATKT